MIEVPYDINNIPHPEAVWMDTPTRRGMIELVRKYKDIPYLSISCPKIVPDDLEQFVDFYYKHAGDGLRLRPSYDEPWNKDDHPQGQSSSWHNPLWKSLEIYKNPKADDWFGTNTIDTISVDGAKLFPKLQQQIFDVMPFNELFFIRFWSNQMPIGLHKDQDWTFNIPMSFRAIIHDENTQPTFYLSKSREHVEKIYVDLPNDTNTFAFNNGSTFWHGADFFGPHKILLVVSGIPDVDKLDNLLSTSLKNYQ